MLGKPKGKALPSGRYEKKMSGVVMRENYHLMDDSAKDELDNKKALHKNVKKHSMKY